MPREAVRSTQSEVVKCFGLKWICLTILVPLPWSPRPWALPFLTILAPSAQADELAGRRHKTTVGWTIQAVKLVSRWLGVATFILVGDEAYAREQRQAFPMVDDSIFGGGDPPF